VESWLGLEVAPSAWVPTFSEILGDDLYRILNKGISTYCVAAILCTHGHMEEIFADIKNQHRGFNGIVYTGVEPVSVGEKYRGSRYLIGTVLAHKRTGKIETKYGQVWSPYLPPEWYEGIIYPIGGEKND
jgi:hypothetical protein